MSVSVLMPWRGDGDVRTRIWDWMRERWNRTMPDAELVVADDNHDDPRRFNEGQAFNKAARVASGGTYLLAEAEVAFNPDDLRQAITTSRQTGDWLIAARYHQLTREHSEQLLDQDPAVEIEEPLVTDRSWFAESVSSILVVPAHVFHEAGGYEERYPGWGHIDKVFNWTLSTLYRPPVRFQGSMFHLWHPRVESSDSNPELTHRYLQANGNRRAILALVAER